MGDIMIAETACVELAQENECVIQSYEGTSLGRMHVHALCHAQDVIKISVASHEGHSSPHLHHAISACSCFKHHWASWLRKMCMLPVWEVSDGVHSKHCTRGKTNKPCVPLVAGSAPQDL